MDKHDSTLRNLEIIMTEFFAPGTTNERKQAIEHSLNEFAARSDWRSCLNYICMTNNNYVIMFILSTLEKIIATNYCSLENGDQEIIRYRLQTMSMEAEVAPFIRNKIMKLVIDVNIYNDHNNFLILDTILLLLQPNQNYQKHMLGLKYLQIICDEFQKPGKNKSYDLNSYNYGIRYNYFRELLPKILDTLTDLLSENLRVQSCSGTKTPPPSPTSGENLTSGMSNFNITDLGNNSNEICILSLKVISHIFSYLESFKHVTKKIKLFDLIFACAKYHDSMSGKQMEAVIQAIGAINDLLYRADLSILSDDLHAHFFNNACELFQSMSHLDNVDEIYLDKTTEFLKLFVMNYLKRSESIPKFSAKELFEILYHRTFHPASTINSYLKCLEIWNDLLDIRQLQQQILLLNLPERILQKFSFRLDSRNLKELNTETVDENGETEWQHFLRCNIECLAKISELTPVPIFTLLYQTWQEGMRVFGELASIIISKQSLELNNMEASNCHNYLRDTASLTQALARISSTYLYNENNAGLFAIEELVSVTLDACDFIKSNCLYSANVQPFLIVHDIVEVYSQLLASLQAWCHWIWKSPDKAKEKLSERCVNTCIWALSATHCNSAPSKLIHSATHLFQSITVILKPNLWGHPLYKELLCSRIHPHLMENDTKQVLNKALINSIILPEGENSLKLHLLHAFVSNSIELIDANTHSRSFPNAQVQIPTESNIVLAIVPLKQALEDCLSASTMIKKMLLECIKPCIERSIQLLPHFMHNENIFILLLNFLHVTFMVLQHQLGQEFTAYTIKNLLELYNSEHLFTGSALDPFLEILLCIVSAPHAFKSFIPSIINLCLVNVWPAINSDLGARQDTVLVMLRLFHGILIHRWKYFYAAPILQNLSSNGGQEVIEHKEELVAILEIFGQVLLQPDINIFRQSLECLEQVNTKWRLYSRELFKSHLLERYVIALMTVLFQKSQDLLTDEILVTLYSMAMVDADLFYYKFLINFIDRCSNVNTDLWKNYLIREYVSTDQPTFTTKIMDMIDRLRRDPKIS